MFVGVKPLASAIVAYSSHLPIDQCPILIATCNDIDANWDLPPMLLMRYGAFAQQPAPEQIQYSSRLPLMSFLSNS